ncbi:MAG: PadR family transcriptional regulator [Candidatus Pacebacteria bacterium]|jgi:DNA-binding PadR family transcriptional regulator|nr:PadR family transcriptional regulator [Candidatus Paceibacterota bacterium]
MLPIRRLIKSNTTDNLWLYILALLEKQPLYGWEIPGLIEQKFGFRPGKITPYRVFYRLEADGFVKSRTQDRRRTYEITAKGRAELEKAKEFYNKALDLLN